MVSSQYMPLLVHSNALSFGDNLLISCLEVDSWIVSGDFNNLEAVEDKTGGIPFVELPSVKQGPWEQFLFAARGRNPCRESEFT